MMRVFLFFAALVAFSSAANVEVLTSSNFASSIADGNVWFVKFYTTWCGFCKRLAPTWEELGAAVQEGAAQRVGKVDCGSNADLCQRLGVQGYPTLKVFDGDSLYNFVGGDRSLNTLRSFFVGGQYRDSPKQTNPMANGATADAKLVVEDGAAGNTAVVPLTRQNFYSRVSSGRWLVASTAPWCGHCKSLAPTLEQLALQKDLSFQVANMNCEEDPDLCRELGVESYPTLNVIEGGFRYRHRGGRALDDLKRFASTDYLQVEYVALRGANSAGEEGVKKRKSLILLDDSNFDALTSDDAWLIGFTCSSAACTEMESQLANVQKSYSLHLRVGLLDCEASPVACRDCHQVTSSKPAIVLLYQRRAFSYTSADFSSPAMAKFVSEGFKEAPSFARQHISEKKQLTWEHMFNREALEDFVRQQRYMLVLSLAFGLVVFGLLMGGAVAHSPSAIRAFLQAEAAAMRRKEQQGSKKKK